MVFFTLQFFLLSIALTLVVTFILALPIRYIRYLQCFGYAFLNPLWTSFSVAALIATIIFSPFEKNTNANFCQDKFVKLGYLPFLIFGFVAALGHIEDFGVPRVFFSCKCHHAYFTSYPNCNNSCENYKGSYC